jgi:hypothetical protein
MPDELQFIESEWVPIEQLEYAQWNYKQEDEAQARALKESMLRTGNCVDLNVAQREEEPDSDTWEVFDGNHRLAVYHDLGAKKVLVKKHGRLPKSERMRRGIELNENSFESNRVKLVDCFLEMVNEFEVPDLAQTMPYDDGEIRELLKSTEFDLTNFFDSGQPRLKPEKDEEVLVFEGEEADALREGWNHYCAKNEDCTMNEMVLAMLAKETVE